MTLERQQALAHCKDCVRKGVKAARIVLALLVSVEYLRPLSSPCLVASENR